MAPMQRWPSVNFFSVGCLCRVEYCPQSLSCIIVYHEKPWKHLCSCCMCHILMSTLLKLELGHLQNKLDTAIILFLEWFHSRSIGFNGYNVHRVETRTSSVLGLPSCYASSRWKYAFFHSAHIIVRPWQSIFYCMPHCPTGLWGVFLLKNLSALFHSMLCFLQANGRLVSAKGPSAIKFSVVSVATICAPYLWRLNTFLLIPLQVWSVSGAWLDMQPDSTSNWRKLCFLCTGNGKRM